MVRHLTSDSSTTHFERSSDSMIDIVWHVYVYSEETPSQQGSSISLPFAVDHVRVAKVYLLVATTNWKRTGACSE
jgi:hypothetical protein